MEKEKTMNQQKMLIYRRATLLQALGVSKTTLRNWMIQEKFPHPIQLGPRSVGWVASQVHEWLEKRPVTSPNVMTT